MKRSVEPDFKLDKKKFGKALMAAIGTRSVAQFSKDAEISYAYLSKYKNMREDKTPTPQTLKKIALVSQGPSYKELLEAAGYDSDKYEDDDISATMVNNEWSPMNTLLPTLCRTGFKWQFVNEGTAGAPLSAKIEDAPFERWYFIPVTKENVTKEDILAILGSKEAEVISSDSKVTFLTANENVYNQMKDIELNLISLRISVALVNKNDGLIGEECYLNTSVELTDKDRVYVLTDKGNDKITPLSL